MKQENKEKIAQAEEILERLKEQRRRKRSFYPQKNGK